MSDTSLQTLFTRLFPLAACCSLPLSAPADSWIMSGEPVEAVISLVISSDIDPAAITQSASQLLTFIFEHPVTDFDESDVMITGGSKGTFTAVSSNVFTLDLIAQGGVLTVSVDADAATPSEPFTNTAEATFSSFYQDTWTIDLPGSIPLELIRIPAGVFTMGAPETEVSNRGDENEHQVTLTEDFYLGKTEVTQEQWAALQSFPGTQIFPGAQRPVHNVSWLDVDSWIGALNTEITESGTFALPTESQWEYACRAGTTTRFSFGDGLSTDELCALGGERELNLWYCGNSNNSIQAVGEKLSNPWGLYDMHGNAFEHCSDWYRFYPGDVTDPTGPETGTRRTARGGSWGNAIQNARSALRNSFSETLRDANIGFRIVGTR